jgi:alcohol dehydrogenase class IV
MKYFAMENAAMIQQYYMPSKILMGEDCVQTNSEAFLKMGKKALIVTGEHSAKKNGSFDDIIKVLSSNGQTWALFDKIMSNPTIESVYEGAAIARSEQVDFIIAIGGGSPMDAAKAINLLACQDIPESELFRGQYTDEILPMVMVPTTAGTGSEVTPFAVLTDNRAQTKKSIASDILFAEIVILDAKYMDNLPKEITINTTIDALSHSIEGMLSLRANPITDSMALESIRRISKCFDSLKTGELTREQRFELLYASTLAGMVITNSRTTALHALGYPLTYFHNIDHGRANGLLLGEYLKYFGENWPERANEILSAMGFSKISDFIDLLDELFGEKEMLTDEQIEKYVSMASQSFNYKNSRVIPSKDDMIEILKTSLKKDK